MTAIESRMWNKSFNSGEKKRKAKISLKDCNKWKEESSMNTKSRGKWVAEDEEKALVSSCQYSCLQS